MLEKDDYTALDTLTLAEIEALFGKRRAKHDAANSKKQAQPSGSSYPAMPGAIFFEIEDLNTT